MRRRPRRLSALGAAVVVNSSSSVEAGQAVASSLPGESLYVQADISDQAQGRDLLDRTVERFGRLDILVNNAGWTTVVPHDRLDELTDEIFLKTFEVNVFGTWWLTKAAIPLLRGSDDPSVVTITSIAGVRPVGSSMAYSMAKGGAEPDDRAAGQVVRPPSGSMRWRPGWLRRRGPRPGTPSTPPWPGTAPLHRSATPDDCAEAVLGLLRMRYATGQVVVVDGGAHHRRLNPPTARNAAAC